MAAEVAAGGRGRDERTISQPDYGAFFNLSRSPAAVSNAWMAAAIQDISLSPNAAWTVREPASGREWRSISYRCRMARSVLSARSNSSSMSYRAWLLVQLPAWSAPGSVKH